MCIPLHRQFNPEDYVNGDIEGGDTETRRRGACDLLRGMCKHFEEPTTRICSNFVTAMYQEYRSNPETNWRSKDAAVRGDWLEVERSRAGS